MRALFPVLVCLLFTCTTLLAQNNFLRGVVKLKSSGSQPLAEVKISSFGASSAFSNEDGMFELQFPNKSPGNRISLIVNKTGYEVINADEVEKCRLRSDADDLIVIVMAREGERDKEALRHYNIMIDYEDEKFREEEATLQSKINDEATDADEVEKLKAELYQLEVDRDRWRVKAEQLAPQLASIDLDRTSEIVRQAYRFFNRGQVREAIVALEEEVLAENLQQAVRQNTQAKEKLIAAKSNLEMCVESYMVKARFCISNKEYETALQCYLTAYRADSSNLNNFWEILDFFTSMNRQDLAITILKSGLRQPVTLTDRWKMLTELGTNLTSNKDYKLADSVFSRAFNLQYEKTAMSVPEKKALLLNTTTSRAGLYLYTRNRSAEEELNKAIALIKELMPSDSSKYLFVLTSAYSDLAVALESAGKYKEAYDIHLKTVANGEKLIKTDRAYASEFATHLSNLGAFFTRMRKYNDAENAYLRSLTIKRSLKNENEIQHEPSFANTYMNLANLYGRIRQYGKAKPAYDTIAAIFEDLTLKNPNKFEDGLARVKMNQGNVLRDIGEYKEAQKAYLRSLEIRKRWYAKSTERFAASLSSTYQNLGLLYRKMDAYDKSEDAHKLSVEFHPENGIDSLRDISPTIASLRMDFGNLYKTTFQIEKSDSLYHLAANAHSNQVKRGNDQYQYNLTITLINHSELYAIGLEKYWLEKYQQRGKNVLAVANDALSKLSERNQQRFSGYLAKYDSILNMYTPEELFIRRSLLDISASRPDSLTLDANAASDQARYVKEIKKLGNQYPTSTPVRTAEAEGLSYLWWIQVAQDSYTEAYATIKRAREVLPEDLELIARDLVSCALLKDKRSVEKIVHTELWKNCSTCGSSLAKIADSLEGTITDSDTDYLRSLIE